MLRVAALVVLAACGRISFDSVPATDATSFDVATDADSSGLIARYRMDDDPDGRVSCDLGAGIFDGKCELADCPTIAIGSKLGRAHQYNGASLVALPNQLVGEAPYTITLWMFGQNGPTNGSMVSKAIGAAGNENVLNLLLGVGFGDVVYETSEFRSINSTSLPDLRNVWHHVAVTWDGTTKRLFIDAAEVSNAAATISDSAEAIFLGADIDGGNPALRFIGILDDLRFYNRALDPSEILGVFTSS